MGYIAVHALNRNAAIIDGSFHAYGKCVIYKDIIFRYSGWENRISEVVDYSDLPLVGPDARDKENIVFRNCVFYDYLTGLYINELCPGSEIYGCVFLNNGVDGPVRSQGHGGYFKNTVNTENVTIENNIFAYNFNRGMQIYSGNSDKTSNFIVKGNTAFGNGWHTDDDTPSFTVGADDGSGVHNLWFDENMSYGAGSYGYQAYQWTHFTSLRNNYMPDGKSFNVGDFPDCPADVESGNYWGSATGNQVFLRPNKYDPNLANVTIYNQDEADTVAVDVSGLYENGQTIEAHNVSDYFVDVQSLTVTDEHISIDMQAINRTIRTPLAWGSAPASTFPEFGCFVLEAA